MTSSADPAEFPGTARFRVLARIGQGGMGVVYRAWDRERRTHVALKALRTASAETLFRFKNEFRALADLHHPNLCALGELVHDGGRWFFTMELVDGVDLLAYVRPPLPGGEPGPLDAPRLRRALVQLARGLDALHARGRVHRDIKPSNILVSMAGNEERVVLVDFGLTTSLVEPRVIAPDPAGEPPSDMNVVGTVDYMAPEQAASRPTGPEADWYSVGVVLYEALTGQLPFQGAPLEILIAKQQSAPPPVSAVAPDAPPDLASLCDALLSLDPRARPRSDDVRQRLRGDGAPDPSTRLRLVPGGADGDGGGSVVDPIARVPSGPSEAPFVGRARELGGLEEAFSATLGPDGVAQTIVVHGESGVGKSALVRRFLDGIWARQPNAVVLTGRCLEQESVPYKAVDGVIDALARVLRRMPRPEAAALLPLEVALLGQVFPVLRRVQVIAEAPVRRVPAGVVEEQQMLRARVFAALRELLTRLAARRPLVVAIDDLQWADDDSLALLAALLREPEAPTMMTLFTLRAGAPPLELGLQPGRVRHVYVGRLPADEAAELARILLGADPPSGTPLDVAARTIAAEAQGHPLFIDELVRHARMPGDPDDGQPLHLEDALRARIAQLPAEARRLLDVIALAGLPIGLDAAAEAAGLPTPADPPPFADTRTPPPPVTSMIPQPAPLDDGVPSLGRLLTALRAGRLVRTARAPSSGLPLVEPFHDRVRDATLRALQASSADEVAALHGALARALEARGADAETLSRHYAGAGDQRRAAELAARAAEDAVAALAFDRAARLLRRALELDPAEGPQRASRAARLGEALAALGRSGDAALAYLEAARDEPKRPEALSLQNRAAQLLLVSGHVDEGLAALDGVLRSVGLALPPTPAAAMRSYALRTLVLRVRGLGFRERDPDRIAPEVLRRIDACWSVASGLGMVDVARAAAFEARHLSYALSAGEPRRVARAIALHAVFQGAIGRSTPGTTEAMCARAEALAERLGDAHALGLAAFARGVSNFLDGKLTIAHDSLSRALTIFTERCVGVVWERSTAMHYLLLCHLARGDLGHVVRRMPELRHSARERGDYYQTLVFRTGPFVLCALAEDDPERGRTEASEALATWSQQGFQLQHLWELTARVWCDLYSDDGRTALDRLIARWPTIERTLIFRVPYLANELYALRGRAALAATSRLVASDPERAALIAEAEGYARRVDDRDSPPRRAQAALLRAGIAATRGDTVRAIAELEVAERGFFEAEMHLYRAVAARRRGQLLGDAGTGVVADAEAWMATQRVKSPRRMCSLFAPGFSD